MKKIVLVSSAQPSANPRLVKEAVSLYAVGYAVTVIYCSLSPWADIYDHALFLKYPGIKWVKAGYHSNYEKWSFTVARWRRKFYSYLYLLTRGKFLSAEYSASWFVQELLKTTLQHPADLYIGHNPAALFIVVSAAKKYSAKLAFDFEDFHRGEEREGSLHWNKIKFIEDRYVRKLDYATTASDLINQAYQEIYPDVSFTVINNCFPYPHDISIPAGIPDQPLRLFWFSQFLGKDRGLETIIRAMSKLPLHSVSLTMLGNAKPEMKSYFLTMAQEMGLNMQQLIFLYPMSVEQIVHKANEYHIGVASEISDVKNRDLCLVNKIFIYLISGNAILFSDTSSHKRFLSENPGIGIIYNQQDADSLAVQLMDYLEYPEKLTTARRQSRDLGKNRFNWEKEQERLLSLIHNTINSA